MPAHKVVADKQMDMLLEHMEADRSFAIGAPIVNDPTLKSEVRQKWERLATELNAIGGANKSPSKWRDYWSERKYAARKKAEQKLRQDTGKDPPKKITFSTAELRILSLISNSEKGNVKRNLPEVPLFEHFNVQEVSVDIPSPPPLSPPPVYILDPSAGPSDPQFMKAFATIKTPDSPPPEQKSPIFAEESQAPQVMQELEDRLIVTEERKVAAIERQTAAIERQIVAIGRQTAAIGRQTAAIERKTAAIERKTAAFTESIGTAANGIVASIDRLAKALLAENRHKRLHITPVRVRTE